MLTHAHSEIVLASPSCSSRMRHRNALTERAWKDAVRGLGKSRLFTAYLCIIRPVVVLHAKEEKREVSLIIYLGRELIRSSPKN